jgi:ligand-binding SRPBCC domain-containing protein
MSKVYNLKTVQFLPISIEKAWDFFSSPTNLSKITPAELKFKILSTDLTKVYAGQVIEYKVHPILGIPLYWMTEITQVEHHKYFVDDQRYGPYSMWHHQHHFKVVEGGVEMTDIVHYKLPFWIFGDIANTLFVKAKLKEIFDYRIKKVAEIF